MEIRAARGDEVDVPTLHAILALRSEVFVVEQSCHYQDVDGRDLDRSTRHLWIADPAAPPAAAIQAYLRILEGTGQWRIGRVVTARAHRRQGLAAALVERALAETGRPVVLSAQSHLTRWYADFGFAVDGREYLDAGILHTPMRLDA